MMAMDREGEEFKPDLASTLIRVIMYVFFLNAPFLGTYMHALEGESSYKDFPILLVGFLILGISLFFANRFFGIRFGWNSEGVYKRGVFRYTQIPWPEIERIYETGVAQEWTESDMLFFRRRAKGKKVFVVRSKDKRIVLEFYTTMIGFRKTIAARLNLEVGDDYNSLWDFIVNG